MERFSSMGGMMPEQIWDFEDIPSESLFLGRSAGSAQPLVWAHSEYLKLLRSAADGRVFDRISVVEERYAVEGDKRAFTNHTEIFQIARPLSTILAGHTLRIVNAQRFELVYTFDEWITTLSLCSTPVGYAGWFVDIPTSGEEIDKVILTIKWPRPDEQDRWLGRNIEVFIIPPAPPHAS
jgi:glucoamylase